MSSYKGITFAKGYNKSFADFKEEFGSTHIFNEMHPEVREKELEKAYEIAISKSVNEIDVADHKTVKPNGKLPTTTEKSKESSTK